MIDIIIHSFKEPKSTLRAVKKFLEQADKLSVGFRIIVVDPFVEVKDFLKQNIKDKRVGFFLDPGEGKTYATNLLLNYIKSEEDEDVIIFSDGDVYPGDEAVKEIMDKFKDSQVGCVAGKPVSVDSRSEKFGYWSKLLYDGVDKVRKKLDKKERFFQVSGYLFAIRKPLLEEIPPDIPEDAVIPFMAWKKGYKIAYADKAEVFVKYPDNWDDWFNQRVRTIKAHENIGKLVPDMPRTKSFWSEIKNGLIFSLFYPRSLKEFFWTLSLYSARLKIYYASFKEGRKKESAFDPGWREQEIQSTKPLD
jgi:cellulose synthase/poly-beta-1,6-N-acetylglucosamine synthase-like glycosyltransferase